MAGHTRLAGMGASEFKIRHTVIKVICLPAGHLMASFTSLIGIVFLIDISGMYILMAIDTSFPYILETPPCGFSMACNTRGSQMGPFQRQTSFIMLIYSIQTAAETIDGMAFSAIRAYTVHRKFSFMVISVARGTAVVG